MLDSLRVKLSRPDAMTQLAILGLVTGILAGGVIVAFRYIFEGLQGLMLPGGLVENYEALPIWARVMLPLAGSLLIAVIFRLFAKGVHVVGVVHVMERLSYHQGHLGLRGLIMQFLGGGIAILSGHSVGREGPGIHLGAAASSLLGRKLGLPNNAIRTLVGCGSAAAIAASFNTPLAAVVFSLEVIMMEYTLASFTPVILAAVSATAITQGIYGSESAFSVPPLELSSLKELPFIMLLGIITGFFSAGFISLVEFSARYSKSMSLWSRLALAGILVGVLGVFFPQIMSIGYDTVNLALLGDIGIGLLLGIMAFKLIATAGSIGLGVPGGLIGPTLVIGATLGGAMGTLAAPIFPEITSHSGLYALLGMGAMMGATLQAPLAALTAVFELTGNPNIILPGMLVIIFAGLTSSQLFGKRSVFQTIMQLRGLDYEHDPIMQAMRRMGVASMMNRQIKRAKRNLPRSEAEQILKEQPIWIIVDEDKQPTALLPAVDLARFLQENEDEQLDLLQIPAKRLQAGPIDLLSSMDQARKLLQDGENEALYVKRMNAPGITRIYGVLTREGVENAYRI